MCFLARLITSTDDTHSHCKACDNCTKRGYDCPGYKKALKWSTKYEVLQSNESDSQKTVHPSVEYHFSSIDPVMFGQDFSTHQDANQELAVTLHTPSQSEPQDQESDSRISRQSNSPEEMTQWKSLLRAYYRMAAPSISRCLQNDSTRLVEHYFRHVCVLYSGFDSRLNPFRTVIGKLWDNSSSIFYAIQSMAAAHLANNNASMGVQGLQMQRKAYGCLQQELQLAHVNQQVDDKLLLTVLLLGMSSPWHEATDLGMAHLNAARGLIYPRLLRNDNQTEEMARNDQFFAEALIYWEMCVAFVHNEPSKRSREKLTDRTDCNEARTIGVRVMPHPWTGVGPRAQMIFAEVGRLIRSYRALSSPLSYGVVVEEVNVAEIIAAAAAYEDELLAIRWPAMDDLVDVQDESTSKLDFIMVAEATRCSALLEIYRVFPRVLQNRFARLAQQPHIDMTGNCNEFFFPFCGKPLHHDYTDSTAWLTSLARHILLDVLGAVPTTSGTRPLQLLMIVTAAAELRLSGLCSDIALARDFALTRFQELSTHLPAKPIFILIRLVTEVWRRCDSGDDGVFWLDVMHENGWQTVMG
jgi:hypothetical protein